MPLFKLLFEEYKAINWPCAGQVQPLEETTPGVPLESFGEAAGVTAVDVRGVTEVGVVPLADGRAGVAAGAVLETTACDVPLEKRIT